MNPPTAWSLLKLPWRYPTRIQWATRAARRSRNARVQELLGEEGLAKSPTDTRGRWRARICSARRPRRVFVAACASGKQLEQPTRKNDGRRGWRWRQVDHPPVGVERPRIVGIPGALDSFRGRHNQAECARGGDSEGVHMFLCQELRLDRSTAHPSAPRRRECARRPWLHLQRLPQGAGD